MERTREEKLEIREKLDVLNRKIKALERSFRETLESLTGNEDLEVEARRRRLLESQGVAKGKRKALREGKGKPAGKAGTLPDWSENAGFRNSRVREAFLDGGRPGSGVPKEEEKRGQRECRAENRIR